MHIHFATLNLLNRRFHGHFALSFAVLILKELSSFGHTVLLQINVRIMLIRCLRSQFFMHAICFNQWLLSIEMLFRLGILMTAYTYLKRWVLILIAQQLIFEAAFTLETIVVAWTWVVIVINGGFPCFVNVIGRINIRSSTS